MSCICNKLISETMDTLGIWAVLTKHLSCSNFIFWVYWGAVKTFSSRSMITFRAFIFHFPIFFGKWRFVSDSNTIKALSSRRMIAFWCNSSVFNITGFDATMHILLFGIFRVDLKNSSIDKIWNISNFSSLADSDSFSIFSGNHNILDGNVNFLR